MKVKEKGNYKVRDWTLEVECTGNGWHQKHKPCHSILTLEDGDIVQRRYRDMLGEIDISYGFVCCECHCFTEINSKDIPQKIKDFAPRIAAPYSDAYSELSKKEKELSRLLFP